MKGISVASGPREISIGFAFDRFIPYRINAYGVKAVMDNNYFIIESDCPFTDQLVYFSIVLDKSIFTAKIPSFTFQHLIVVSLYKRALSSYFKKRRLH